MSESENNLRLETVFKRSVQMLYPYTAPQPASASTRLLIFPDPGGVAIAAQDAFDEEADLSYYKYHL
jgi:hypothetical protein